nr:5713_t:CDS:2 [Entrophospora candida]
MTAILRSTKYLQFKVPSTFQGVHSYFKEIEAQNWQLKHYLSFRLSNDIIIMPWSTVVVDWENSLSRISKNNTKHSLIPSSITTFCSELISIKNSFEGKSVLEHCKNFYDEFYDRNIDLQFSERIEKLERTIFSSNKVTEVLRKETINKRNNKENTITEREKRTRYEDSPTPVNMESMTESFIISPNKPTISMSLYKDYFAHIICAFNATMKYIKKSLDENTYQEIREIQSKNKFILEKTITKKLETIFESGYTEIETKILSETNISDNTEESRFLFFIRQSLLDFVYNFKFSTPKMLDRDLQERSYIVELLAPIFRAFRNSFPNIKYHWIEKYVTSIKDVNNMFMNNLGERKTDLLVLRQSDGREVLLMEVSGPPFKIDEKHTVGDAKKLLIMAICSLCRIFGDNLDCNIDDAKKVRTYSIQVIGNRLTLFAVSLFDKKKYLALELSSCIIPFAFDAITCYMKIFNFFAIIRNEFVEQEKLQKKIRCFIPTDNKTDLREWLHLPDLNLQHVAEEALDEILL